MAERHLKLAMQIEEGTEDLALFVQKLVENPVGVVVIAKLSEEEGWKELPLDSFASATQEETVRESVADFESATILYPHGSLSSIEQSLECLLPGGLILISDKGIADAFSMQSDEVSWASIHGNSFAHSLNFPLLEGFANKLGWSATRTTSPDYPIHTLLVEKRTHAKLTPLFTELFIEHNANLDCSDFVEAAKKFEELGEYAVALRFYERSLRLLPGDARIRFEMGKCAIEAKELERGLALLHEGAACDPFSEYDFDFHIGFALHLQEQYQAAIDYYWRSQERIASKVTLCNISLCHEQLGETDQAIYVRLDSLAHF